MKTRHQSVVVAGKETCWEDKTLLGIEMVIVLLLDGLDQDQTLGGDIGGEDNDGGKDSLDLSLQPDMT